MIHKYVEPQGSEWVSRGDMEGGQPQMQKAIWGDHTALKMLRGKNYGVTAKRKADQGVDGEAQPVNDVGRGGEGQMVEAPWEL